MRDRSQVYRPCQDSAVKSQDLVRGFKEISDMILVTRQFSIDMEANPPENRNADCNNFYCAGNPKIANQFLERQRRDVIEENSVAADPLFVDVENGDFRLKGDSPALKLGFEPINTTKIGLTEDF